MMSAAWARSTFQASASVKTLSSAMIGMPIGPQRCHRFGVARRDRLFGEQQVELTQLSESDPRRREVPAAIGVDGDRDIGAGQLRARPARARRHRPGRAPPSPSSSEHPSPETARPASGPEAGRRPRSSSWSGWCRGACPPGADRPERPAPCPRYPRRAISTADLVNGLSLIRKSITFRSSVIWVGSLPTSAGPIRSLSAATRALACLTAPERRHGRLAQARPALRRYARVTMT